MNKKQGVIYLLLAALLLWAPQAPANGIPCDIDPSPISSSDQPLGEPEEENEESESELKELAAPSCWIDHLVLEPAAAFDLDDNRIDVLDCFRQSPDLPRAPPTSG